MSDPPPPSPPPVQDVRRKPPAVPGFAGGAPDGGSGFLSRGASILLIVFGGVLAGPGFCYYATAHMAVDLIGPLIFMAGLTMIVGGSVWFSEIGRARRARRQG